MKELFWKIISPLFLFARDVLLRVGIIWHNGRQRFLLGVLVPERTPEALLRHLEMRGFQNHFIAWVDDGQSHSIRKITSDRKFQYHLRIFKDGEVRGHFEYTPEAHPIWHQLEKGVEERREDFLEILGDWIVPTFESTQASREKWPLTSRQ